MAVYEPVRHQNNIIWTSEASVYIYIYTSNNLICKRKQKNRRLKISYICRVIFLMFNEQRGEGIIGFVDIGGIVLNFLFIAKSRTAL